MRIKKLIFCLLCALSLSPVYSQRKLAYKLGLTGGVSAAQINSPSLKTTTGLLWHYTTGIALQQRFSQKFALAYELKYARQGGKAQPFGYDFITTESNYVSLPIIGQFQPKGGPMFIEIGGQIGYFLSSRSYFVSHKDQALSTSTQNINRLDAGLLAGVGYRFGQHLVIDARYYYGMRRIYENFEIADPVTGIPILFNATPQYNRLWSLNLSYYF
ncbi:porin family protein [Fibrella forsythiae]|uniref:PorT family protein n=1 Tax=Fibrella forsythiae TaxID=2817061 RepID=A0ABS3JVF6_9BACT|nr:porin family protein [Fibrella forsythiae]MBO0953159.1 PorT family protein [Fibrella forsythiae]